MTLVKKQYNGRELPVFDNMDEATEHFSKARKTILWVMIIFSACYSFFVAVLLSFSYQLDLGELILSFIGGFVIYSASCSTEADIRAPKAKDVRLIYSKKEGKWLIFPKDDYPAVAFVQENENDTMEEDYTIEDYVVDVLERDLKKNAVVDRIFAAGIFLSAVFMPISYILCVAIPVGAVIIGMVILCW